MRVFFTCIFAFCNFLLFSQCSGLTISAYNSDNADQILLTATDDISPNTVFYITDNEWDGTNFNSGEDIITFTSPNNATILSGSAILLEGSGASCGTISGIIPALSTTGEEIYITSVNPSGSVAVTNICHAVLFGGSGSIAGISGSIDNGDFDNWDGTTTSNNRFTTLSGSCSTILPVEFSKFSVNTIEKSSIISFSTASETNNDYFTIERSGDGRSFESIGEIKGAGNSNQELSYEFVDESPLAGINYYRIKQTDFDGAYSYTEIRSVRHQTKNVIVSPNRTDGKLNVTSELDNYDVVIYNTGGQEVQRHMALSGDQSLSIETLQAGVYFVKVMDQTIRILKF